MAVQKYRKKPVIIEAIQWDGTNVDEILGFVLTGGTFKIDKIINESLFIPTLEGEMHATKGDWIIKGVKGEFYPCKPDIFEATYEAAV